MTFLTVSAWCLFAFMCFVIAHRLFLLVRQIRMAWCIPTVSGAWPIIGHGLKICQDKIKLVEDIDQISKEVDNYGGIGKLWLGPILIFLLTDPEDSLIVANACLKKSYIMSFGESWLGGGLSISPPSIWKPHRKLLNPAFSPRLLNGFLDVFNKQSQLFSKRLANEASEGDFDLMAILQDIMFDSVCQTTFGIQTDSEIMERYKVAKDEIMDIFMTRLRIPWMHLNSLYSWSRLKKAEDRLANILHNTTMQIMHQATEKRIEVTPDGKTKATNFLDLMLDLQQAGSFTEQEVREELDTLIFTGHDTLSVQLTLAFVLLGAHPEIQDRLFNEIHQVFGDSMRDVTKDDLPNLPLLDAVIKETTRLYPIGSIVMRDIDHNIRLKNFTIPEGTMAVISVWGINRSRIWGNDAAIFNPDRWLDPSSLPKHPAAFASFSIGRRNCIGKNYAILSMKTTLIVILRKYIIKSNLDSLKLELEVMLKPESGHHVSVALR